MFVGFSELNTKLPATNASAPASTNLFPVSKLTPPSTSIRALEFSEDDYNDFVKPAQFITDKPVMYVCNVDEASAVNGNAYV